MRWEDVGIRNLWGLLHGRCKQIDFLAWVMDKFLRLASSLVLESQSFFSAVLCVGDGTNLNVAIRTWAALPRCSSSLFVTTSPALMPCSGPSGAACSGFPHNRQTRNSKVTHNVYRRHHQLWAQKYMQFTSYINAMSTLRFANHDFTLFYKGCNNIWLLTHSLAQFTSNIPRILFLLAGFVFRLESSFSFVPLIGLAAPFFSRGGSKISDANGGKRVLVLKGNAASSGSAFLLFFREGNLHFRSGQGRRDPTFFSL